MQHFHLPKVPRRRHVVAAIAGIAALVGGGVLLAAPSNPANASAFHIVPTVRLLDTRAGAHIGSRGTPLEPDETFDLDITGIPDDATGVSINVTAVDGTAWSFMTVYPSDDARPNTSTINWNSTDPVANSATVQLHADRSLAIYNSAGTVNVIIDLLGYYAPSPVGNGSAGPAGPTGPTGPTGPRGLPGIGGGAIAYAFASNTSSQTVVADSAVTFDLLGPIVGITTDAADNQFTVPTAGVYKVSFGVVADEASQLSILVNDVDAVPDPMVFGSSAGGPFGGTTYLTLDALDTISLANTYSAAGIDLSLPVGGPGPMTNAWISIEQLS